jgi:hypothetical protein
MTTATTSTTVAAAAAPLPPSWATIFHGAAFVPLFIARLAAAPLITTADDLDLEGPLRAFHRAGAFLLPHLVHARQGNLPEMVILVYRVRSTFNNEEALLILRVERAGVNAVTTTLLRLSPHLHGQGLGTQYRLDQYRMYGNDADNDEYQDNSWDDTAYHLAILLTRIVAVETFAGTVYRQYTDNDVMNQLDEPARDQVVGARGVSYAVVFIVREIATRVNDVRHRLLLDQLERHVLVLQLATPMARAAALRTMLLNDANANANFYQGVNILRYFYRRSVNIVRSYEPPTDWLPDAAVELMPPESILLPGPRASLRSLLQSIRTSVQFLVTPNLPRGTRGNNLIFQIRDNTFETFRAELGGLHLTGVVIVLNSGRVSLTQLTTLATGEQVARRVELIGEILNVIYAPSTFDGATSAFGDFTGIEDIDTASSQQVYTTAQQLLDEDISTGIDRERLRSMVRISSAFAPLVAVMSRFLTEAELARAARLQVLLDVIALANQVVNMTEDEPKRFLSIVIQEFLAQHSPAISVAMRLLIVDVFGLNRVNPNSFLFLPDGYEIGSRRRPRGNDDDDGGGAGGGGGGGATSATSTLSRVKPKPASSGPVELPPAVAEHLLNSLPPRAQAALRIAFPRAVAGVVTPIEATNVVYRDKFARAYPKFAMLFADRLPSWLVDARTPAARKLETLLAREMEANEDAERETNERYKSLVRLESQLVVDDLLARETGSESKIGRASCRERV